MKKSERKWKYIWEESGDEKNKNGKAHEKVHSEYDFGRHPVLRHSRPMRFEFELSYPRMAMPKFPTDIDISQTNKEVVAKISIPGFGKDDIELSLSHDAIHMRAEKKKSEKKDSEGMSFSMMQKSATERSFSLPAEIEPREAKAKLENGILTVIMPKKRKNRFNIFG